MASRPIRGDFIERIVFTRGASENLFWNTLSDINAVLHRAAPRSLADRLLLMRARRHFRNAQRLYLEDSLTAAIESQGKALRALKKLRAL